MTIHINSDRFWSKVERGPGCWTWKASCDTGGYGQFRLGSQRDGTRRMEKAHRVAWELTYGLIPDGLFVCHRCDNPKCVNAAGGHLFLGTQLDNMRDRKAKKRGNHRKGERHGRAKLTADDIPIIRALYASGDVRQIDLASEYGVSQVLISKVIRRDLWREIHP